MTMNAIKTRTGLPFPCLIQASTALTIAITKYNNTKVVRTDALDRTTKDIIAKTKNKTTAKGGTK
jgi:hypothetical protein